MRPVIVFDLDGTLVDSLDDIVASFLEAFRLEGLSPPPEPAARRRLGQPLDEMFGAFAPAERVDELCRRYRSHYALHQTDRSRPFPGVREVLAALGERGYLRAVASTKGTDTARRLVAATGLGAFLDHVEGTDRAPFKPAPDVVWRAVRAVGGRGEWMVGDTTGDILAGRAAGLRTYGVTWGTHGEAELATAGPTELQPDLTRLVDLLAPVRAS